MLHRQRTNGGTLGALAISFFSSWRSRRSNAAASSFVPPWREYRGHVGGGGSQLHLNRCCLYFGWALLQLTDLLSRILDFIFGNQSTNCHFAMIAFSAFELREPSG